ncbi:MAG: hypothetical protein ACLFRX_06750, partial [Gemmatimonadota bacterium]
MIPNIADRTPTSLTTGVLLIVLAMSTIPGSARAQELTIIEEPGAAEGMICVPGGESLPGEQAVPPERRREAERLANAATQAMLLGDLDGALEFLDRSLRTDSTTAETWYLRSRVQMERGALESSATDLCRYLTLEPDGPSATEARARLEQLAEQGVAQEIYATFAEGVAGYQNGALEEAALAFGRVIEARPAASAALYNRGLIQALLDRPGPAQADLQRYLTLEPNAPNAALVRRYLLTLASFEGPRP